jgi:hypothetical protein
MPYEDPETEKLEGWFVSYNDHEQNGLRVTDLALKLRKFKRFLKERAFIKIYRDIKGTFDEDAKKFITKKVRKLKRKIRKEKD